MSQPLLEVSVDPRDREIRQLNEQIAELEAENRDLQTSIHSLRAELDQAKRSNAKAVAGLRHTLTPLYKSLKALFDELDEVDNSAEETATQPVAADPRTLAVWKEWQQRLGTTAAKCIDALLIHKELNTQQLAIATGLHRTTIPKAIYALNKAGLISKNGGRFSLKKLS
jgi:chromosome segregation ATPase